MIGDDKRILTATFKGAGVFDWSGTWSFLLVLATWLLDSLSVVKNPSLLVMVLIAALPVVKRWIQQKVSGMPASWKLHSKPNDDQPTSP